jgi:hypothetical protein
MGTIGTNKVEATLGDSRLSRKIKGGWLRDVENQFSLRACGVARIADD